MFNSKKVTGLQDKLLELIKERDVLKSRCIHLENGIEKDFNVKVRNEITNIIVDFTKDELCVLHVALCKFMEKPLHTEDVQYYLALRIKLEDLIEKVKE